MTGVVIVPMNTSRVSAKEVMPLPVQSQAHFACPIPDKVETKVNAQAYYADKKGSEKDYQKWSENSKMLEKFRTPLIFMSKLSDSYQATQRRDLGECVVQILDKWATGGAMLDPPSSLQASYERNRFFAGLGILYLKVKSEAKPDQDRQIKSWLDQLCDRAEDLYNQNPNWRNNLYFWSGLGVKANYKLSHRPQDGDYLNAMQQAVVADVDTDGSIKSELGRGSMSLNYHLHALEPLIAMELANGKVPVGRSDLYMSSLNRATAYTISQVCNPSSLEIKTGVKQVKPETGVSFLFLWNDSDSVRSSLSCVNREKGSFDEFVGGDINRIPSLN
jgi:poly(beta-D-mannuronate) lyase